MEEVHILNGIDNGAVNSHGHTIVLQTRVEHVEVRNGKVHLTALAQIAEIGQIGLFHFSCSLFRCLSLFFFHIAGRLKTKESHNIISVFNYYYLDFASESSYWKLLEDNSLRS